MKRLLTIIILALALVATNAVAATTIIITNNSSQVAATNGKVHWIKWVMTTTTADDVFDGVSLGYAAVSGITGTIIGIMSVPDATNPPAEDYDIALVDAAGADILDAQGANFGAAATEADNRRFPVDSVNALMPITLCNETINISVTGWNTDGTESATFYLYYK